MTAWIVPVIVGGLFAAVGLVLLALPSQVLLRFDRRIGPAISRGASDEQMGLQRVRLVYKALGVILVALPLCSLCAYGGIASGLVQIQGGLNLRTETRAPWMFDLSTRGSKSYLGAERNFPRFSEIHPASTAQIYIVFFAKASQGGQMNCRWLVNGQLQRQFAVRYTNGDNEIKLNDDPGKLIPVGIHEVYLEQAGQILGIVRFKVEN